MKNSYYALVIFGLVWGCANRVQPTGGPRDEDPPELLGSIPKSGQRNFKEQEISLLFDEYVTVVGLKKELIITPRIEGDVDFKIKKKTVLIEFEEPFNDSTTYTFNFRDAIQDITEGTPAQNLILAFSTGDVLDTLQITGTVVDLITQKPLDGITIGLYNIDDTLDLFTGPPYYFGTTDKQGGYTIRNLRDGEYRIYAYNDDNKNLTCESNREAFAFLTESIKLDTAYIADTLNLQYLNLDTLEITRTRSSGQYFQVIANKYLTKASLTSANENSLVYTYADDHKALTLYNTFPIADSLEVFATLEDSLGYIVEDTFYLEFKPSSRKYDSFDVTIKEPRGSEVKKTITGEIVYTKPLSVFSVDSIIIKVDSTEQYLVDDKFSYTIDTLSNKIEYSIEIPQAILDSLKAAQIKSDKSQNGGKRKLEAIKSYSVFLVSGAMISVEGDSSIATVKKIKFINPKQYGNISGNVSTTYEDFIIQLLSKEYKVVDEQVNVSSYAFDEIQPGDYFIRILIDENKNGKWDLADIRSNQSAEPLIIYKDDSGNSKTVVRANWSISLDLSF